MQDHCVEDGDFIISLIMDYCPVDHKVAYYLIVCDNDIF